MILAATRFLEATDVHVEDASNKVTNAIWDRLAARLKSIAMTLNELTNVINSPVFVGHFKLVFFKPYAANCLNGIRYLGFIKRKYVEPTRKDASGGYLREAV